MVQVALVLMDEVACPKSLSRRLCLGIPCSLGELTGRRC